MGDKIYLALTPVHPDGTYPDAVPGHRRVVDPVRRKLRSLIVGSGGTAVPLQLGSLLRDWVETPGLEEFRSAAAAAQQARHPLDAGHFTWEDAADEYAALVTAWWDGGYVATGSAVAR